MATPVAEIERSTKLAREHCLLNNYDTALALYKHVLSELEAFAKLGSNRKTAGEARKLIATIRDEYDTVRTYVEEMNDFANEPPPQNIVAGPPLRTQNALPSAVRNPKDPRDRRRDSAAGTAGAKPTSPPPNAWRDRRERGWDAPAGGADPSSAPNAPAAWDVPPPAPAPAVPRDLDVSNDADSGEERRIRAVRVAEARRAAPRGPVSGLARKPVAAPAPAPAPAAARGRPATGGGQGPRRVAAGPRTGGPLSPTGGFERGGSAGGGFAAVQAAAAAAAGAAGAGAAGRPVRKPGVPRLSKVGQEESAAAGGRAQPRSLGGGQSINIAGETLDLGKENEEIVTAIEREMMVLPHEGKDYGVPFSDIAGLQDVKTFFNEALIAPLLMPHLFTGIRKPWAGVLMYGPPGTGKTMLAKAVATEAGVTFFNVKLAMIVSKWRGDSEKSIQILYNLARHHAPSVIFIDEIDALCGTRGASQEHEASLRTKTEILTQMSGAMSKAEAGKLVLTLGATNLPWNLDSAMLRRLEKHIYIGVPDGPARLSMLKQNMRDCNVDAGVDYMHLVQRTEGYSGSDISNLCRDAAMIKLRRFLAGKDIDELRKLGDYSAVSDGLPVTMDDFLTSLNSSKPTSDRATFAKFEQWGNENKAAPK